MKWKKIGLLSNFKKEVGIFARKPRNLNLSCELTFQPKKPKQTCNFLLKPHKTWKFTIFVFSTMKYKLDIKYVIWDDML